MSFYFKYNFVSPSSLLAEIKEEMDSYFSTGVVDDVMFYTYIEKALWKLGRTTLKIDETPVELNNYQALLPEDFEYVRELWLCTNVEKRHLLPSAKYDVKTCRVVPNYGEFDPCDPCDTCPPDCIEHKTLVYKTTGEAIMNFSLHSLLTPGNVSVKDKCSQDCKNFGASSPWSFDIRDNKIITNICDGVLYLIYYKMERDEDDFQLIPDNFRIQEFIKSFVKYKLYEKIWNSVTDETVNQIERKFQFYKQEADEAYILARIETVKPSLQQTINRIKAQKRSLDKYRLY